MSQILENYSTYPYVWIVLLNCIYYESLENNMMCLRENIKLIHSKLI